MINEPITIVNSTEKGYIEKIVTRFDQFGRPFQMPILRITEKIGCEKRCIKAIKVNYKIEVNPNSVWLINHKKTFGFHN